MRKWYWSIHRKPYFLTVHFWRHCGHTCNCVNCPNKTFTTNAHYPPCSITIAQCFPCRDVRGAKRIVWNWEPERLRLWSLTCWIRGHKKWPQQSAKSINRKFNNLRAYWINEIKCSTTDWLHGSATSKVIFSNEIVHVSPFLRRKVSWTTRHVCFAQNMCAKHQITSF